MRYIFLFIVLVFSFSFPKNAFSQAMAEFLSRANNELSTSLKKASEREDYFREILGVNITTAIASDDIIVRVVDIYGSKSGRVLYVKGIITYYGTKPLTLKFGSSELLDLRGVSYRSSEVLDASGGDQFVVNQPGRYVPYVFVAKFNGIKERMPIVRSINFNLAADTFVNNESYTTSFLLEGMNVYWPKP